MPRGMKMKKEEEEEREGDDVITQMWHRNGTRCPKGTVPIRRSTVHDVLRAKSLFHFGKKRPLIRRHFNPLSRRTDAPDVVSANGHEVLIIISLLIHSFLSSFPSSRCMTCINY